MMQDHQGNYISSNIRGLVYEISKFVSTSDVERAFQRSGLTIKHVPGKRPDTPQAMFTAWSTSIDWKDKRRAVDGLKALSRVTQRARAVEMEQYDGTWVVGFSEYDGWVEELERDCADEGLQYDRGTGRITPNPDAHTEDFVDLDLEVLEYQESVVKAQRKLNDAIRDDVTSWTVAAHCKYLVEAVSKVILNQSAPERLKNLEKPYLDTLTKEVAEYLGLKEGRNSSPAMKDFAAGLQKLAKGLAEVRNRTDDNHPQIDFDPPTVREVRLSLDVTHAWCRFVLAEYRAKLEEPPF